MTANLHCGIAAHAAVRSDDKTFRSGRFHSWQPVYDEDRVVDLLEQRDCPRCGVTLARCLGVETRRERAVQDADMSMIARCDRALRPDPMTGQIDSREIRAYMTAVEFDALMPRVPSDADILELQGYAVAAGKTDLLHDCYEALGYGTRVPARPTAGESAAARRRCAKVIAGMQGGGR